MILLMGGQYCHSRLSAGGLLGGIIGSATHRWWLVFRKLQAPDPRPGKKAPAELSAAKLGGIELSLGCIRSSGNEIDGASIGGRLNLFSYVYPNLDIGLETGFYRTGPRKTIIVEYPDYSYRIFADNTAWHFGGAVRFRKNWRNYQFLAIGGLGYYNWFVKYLGYSFGVGVQSRNKNLPFFFTAETRWHHHLQRLGGTNPDLFTALVGMGIDW